MAAEKPEGSAIVGRRVLVVDDHVDSAELACLHLELRGHVVKVASSNSEALRAAIDFRPEVAILDIWPGADTSYSLARQLRLLPSLEGIRLVAVTAFAGSNTGAEGAAAGATFFRCLTKPIDPSSLAAAVENEPLRYAAM